MQSANAATESCDVLVIGGGGAGLAAAIEAAGAGARVVLVEKNPALGGTTAWSIGSFSATRTPQQLAAGIDDSPDEHFADMPKFSGSLANRDNPALRRLFVDNASDTLRWLMGMGVEFFGPMPEPPHTKPRMHNVLPNSRAYIGRLGPHARRIGVDIRTATRATRFLLDDGRVVGAVCEGAGGTSEIRVRRGVVLASGDYAANAELKAKYISPEVADVDAMNPTATGDGHVMAFPLGAHVLNGDVLSGPTLRFVPPEKETWLKRLPPSRLLARTLRLAMRSAPAWLQRPFVMGFMTTTMAPELDLFSGGALLVNRNGKRIAGDPRSLGLLINAEPGKIGYLIMDDPLARKYEAWPHFISTAPGVAYAYLSDYRRSRPDLYCRANTAAALAQSLGMDAATLAASLAAHNAARTGAGEAPLATPPFHALGPAKSYVVLTDGGLAVNERLQVLGDADRPIEGLYAAGSAGQGGLMLKGHGHHIGWAFTSGRIAGRNAAAGPAR